MLRHLAFLLCWLANQAQTRRHPEHGLELKQQE
jgi:hypothetical protein